MCYSCCSYVFASSTTLIVSGAVTGGIVLLCILYSICAYYRRNQLRRQHVAYRNAVAQAPNPHPAIIMSMYLPPSYSAMPQPATPAPPSYGELDHASDPHAAPAAAAPVARAAPEIAPSEAPPAYKEDEGHP